MHAFTIITGVSRFVAALTGGGPVLGARGPVPNVQVDDLRLLYPNNRNDRGG